MTGLFEICSIQEGDDLQYDIASRDKAAVLVGIFLDVIHANSNHPSAQKIEAWREAGIRFLKQRSAYVFYQKNKDKS
jgi:hypothetical protein